MIARAGTGARGAALGTVPLKPHTTVTDTRWAPVRTYLIGHTVPRGSKVTSVELDGTPVAKFESRETNRGVEVRVPASPDRRHTLAVVAAPE